MASPPRQGASTAAPAEEPPLAGLAVSQLRRMRRIVDTAVALAEKGGFEGVRLRDVAEASDVALGTLYKYFRSKDDILIFALHEEAQRLELDLRARPIKGEDAVERLTDFFARATRALTRKPDFARAVLRAIAVGDHEMAEKVAGFHLLVARMIVCVLRDEWPDAGNPPGEDPSAPPGTAHEQAIATVLNHVWFAALVGWSGGLHPVRTVSERMRETGALLLHST